MRFEYLRSRRWFAGADRAARIVDVETLPWLQDPSTGLGVRVELVTTDDGLVYNVPASYRAEPFPGLDGALMAVESTPDGPSLHVYDALLDAHARTALLAAFAPDLGPVHTTPLIAEQSNTSVVVDHRWLWKTFRVVSPGHNPDIEVASTLGGSGVIAPLKAAWRVGDLDLAMLYTYFPSATDGWDSARASFRDLLADPDLTGAAGRGGDFAAEASRLGATVARVHAALAGLGSDVWTPTELAQLADRLTARFDDHAAVAPFLEADRDAAVRAFDAVRSIDVDVPVQRVHGDLHLGQVLRTVDGWKVFDFEGEPATPLTDRVRLDSPLRDIAGMLRSFDYASRSVLMQVESDSPVGRDRAADWSRHNSEAFLRGYGTGTDRASYALLAAYQVDKAAYEVAYETRHRPGWVGVPRDALDRLLAHA